jgi:Insertion element 4 transposase N-terminal/Transposase DDE domain
MGYRIRQVEAQRAFCRELTLDALARAIPREAVLAALDAVGRRERRHRKITLEATLLLVIAMNLFAELSVSDAFARLAQGLRFVWADPDIALPKDSALSTRRYQLGPRPLVALLRRVARPLASEATEGAFAYGLRLMAIDSSREAVPDTPENAKVFGKPKGRKGEGAFPQVHGVYLAECGTHAIVDCGFWPCSRNERVGALRLKRSIHAGMLVLLDCGFYAFLVLEALLARRAELLCRLPAHVRPRPVRRLSDGTILAAITSPKEAGPRRELLVRVITYTVTDPDDPTRRTTCRLVTSLLDERRYAALDLVCLYHERWEIELVFDEMATHQRLAGAVLRSLKPEGVIQELYGLVLAHYAVRSLMHEAGVAAGLDPRRLSFSGALRVIQQAVPEFQMVAAHQRPRLYARLLRDIAAKRLPERRPRRNPRVVRRQQSKFKRKRPEHFAWPLVAKPFRELIDLL